MSAVGFKDERKDQIEVINMPFVNDILSVDSEDNWLRDQLPSLLQSLVLVVVVGLVFVTIIRPIALRLFDGMRNTKELDVGSEPESRFGEITAEQIEASIVEQKQQTASLKKVNEVMGTHPEEALMVLRKWLNNG